MSLYEDVGNCVIHFVLGTKKRRFTTDDIPCATAADPRQVRRYKEEWLGVFAEPYDGAAYGPLQALEAHPKLGAVVRKKWAGWYPSTGGKRRKAAGAAGFIAAAKALKQAWR